MEITVLDFDPRWVSASAIVLIFALVSLFTRSDEPYFGIPIVGKPANDFHFRKAKANYTHNAHNVLKEGLQMLSGPFQIVTSVGPKIVLPNRYVDEIRNHPQLSFAKQLSKEFCGHLPGFDIFKALHTPLMVDTIRTKLTQSLNFITDDLSKETAAALKERLEESNEWKTLNVSQECLSLINRLSTLVFIGPELCRREDWMEVANSYTVTVMAASHKLRTWPWFLRYLVNIFLPESRTLRRNIREARQIVEPIVAKRRAERRHLAQKGKLPKPRDSIGWLDELSKGQPYDFTIYQLFLTGTAIHTTSNLLGNAILDLCAHPEYVEPLRAEVRAAIREEGWKKSALFRMKTMDSFLKESQRLNPATVATINRQAVAKIQLSDGTIIPKGADLICTMERMMDPAIYEKPDEFDGFRFLKMRQVAGQENSWQFVTTSSDHLGFGHGSHACPGRFFAANEVKVAFAYMIIHYDWRFSRGQSSRPQPLIVNEHATVDPLAQLEYRRTDESLV